MVFKSIFWSFFSQLSGQIISFIISVILIRLLTPEIFGLVAITYIFYALSEVLLDSGMSVSIIRSNNISEKELNSIFFFNIVLGFSLYLILFFASSFIAHYYQLEILTDIIRVMAISIVFNSLVLVQKALFSKNLEFKQMAKINLIAIILSGFIGIYIAYVYQNVWSLVVINVLSTFFTFIFYWWFSKWRPQSYFSFKHVKKHLQFGYKLSLTAIFDVISTNIYNNIIGKNYSTAQAGLYSKADSLKRLAILGISTPLKSVLLPLFSRIREDEKRLREAYINVLNAVLLVISFVLLFLIFNANEIFYILFGEKWLGGVIYFKIICVSGLLYPINTYVVNYLLVVGRSDLVLKYDIIKKVFMFAAIISSLYFADIIFLLYSLVVSAIFDLAINLWIINKNLKIKIIDQIKLFSSVISVNLIIVFGLDYLFEFFSKDILTTENMLMTYIVKTFIFFVTYLVLVTFVSIFVFKSTIVFLKKHINK